MKKSEVIIKKISELDICASNLAQTLKGGEVILCKGKMGVGKTAFAKALGIHESITSPTFNIIKEYPEGELPLYHMDVYRLDGNTNELNIEEYFDKGGVTIIEWADLISDELPEERLDIDIRVTGEDTRVFILTPHGSKYEEICEAVL